MKKLSLLLLPLCLSFVLSSCSKKSADTPSPIATGTGTMSVTIDGSVKTFNVNAYATALNISGNNFVTLYGTESTGTSDFITIAIVNPSIIAGNTYTGVASQVQINYNLTSGAIYRYADDDAAAFASVTIKSVGSSNIQGTFSGNLNLVSGTGAATHTLTSGLFNLRVEPATN
jgi:hypothetical protein